MLDLEPVEPRGLGRAGQLWLCPLRQREKTRGVRVPSRVLLAAGQEALPSVFPDRLEHGKTWFTCDPSDRAQEALVAEGADKVKDGGRRCARGERGVLRGGGRPMRGLRGRRK